MTYDERDEAAEQAVLGGMLMSRDAITDVLSVLQKGSDFYLPKHEQIFDAIIEVYGNRLPVDAVTVAAELRKRGDLRKIGNYAYLHTLIAATPSAANAGYHAETVRDLAKRRRVHQLAWQVAQATRTDVTQTEDLQEAYNRLIAEVADYDRPGGAKWNFVSGARFVLDVPETPPAVWGEGSDVLWAEGEALMIAAPQGVGKTTLAFQLVRARLELQPDVLGYKVAPTRSKVLYLAMDRPSQAQRAAARLFREDDQVLLGQRLVVWTGPPPGDMAQDPTILAEMCKQAGADTVVVDSLKDAAVGLSGDDIGAAYNRARQLAIAEGVQILELHHTRKAGSNGTEPNTIADVYGSTWLTSGAGSVISLYGSPGDPIVSFRHLKQPMNEVGPFRVLHDHAAGTSSVAHGVDLLELVKARGVEGLTVEDAAKSMFEKSSPNAADREKARRKLEKLIDAGILIRRGGTAKTAAAVYVLKARETPGEVQKCL